MVSDKLYVATSILLRSIRMNWALLPPQCRVKLVMHR